MTAPSLSAATSGPLASLIQVVIQPPPAPPVLPDPNIIAGLVQETVLIILAIVAGTIVAVKVLGPVARAFARRLEGKTGDSALRAASDREQERLDDLEQMRNRMAELEERLDFAERLLSQRRDRDLLTPGSPGE